MEWIRKRRDLLEKVLSLKKFKILLLELKVSRAQINEWKRQSQRIRLFS